MTTPEPRSQALRVLYWREELPQVIHWTEGEGLGASSGPDLGRSDGARAFADEFAELTKPSHGECGAECWCHNSVDEAIACAAERVEAAHG